MTLLAWCGEPLERHLLDTLEVYKRIEAKSVGVFLNRLAQHAWIQDSLVRNYVKFAIRLAIGMHDIGKAHPTFRRSNMHKLRLECDMPKRYYCERFCKPDKMPRFRMHEVLSGCIVRKYLNRLLLIVPEVSEKICEFQSKLHFDVIISLAIAYHHEAMHLPIDPQVEDYLSSFDDWNPLEDSEAGVVVQRIVGESLSGSSFGPTFTQILGEFKEARIQFLEAIKAWRETSNPVVKLYALISGPLMICDNLVARRNRGGRAPRTFVAEALQAYPEL
jgi:CRISPR-associated endonuclease Cas3-HD